MRQMPQGLQGNFPHPQIRETGCHFLCMLKWLEIRHGIEFTPERIIQIYDKAVEAKMMDPNCFVRNATGIMNAVLGQNIYRQYVHNIPAPDPKRSDLYVVRLVRPDQPTWTHFILNFRGQTWDTLDPARPAASRWVTDSYRVFA